MLNGVYPIVLFQFKKLDPTAAASFSQLFQIPIAEVNARYVSLPPIPIYIDEVLTGIAITQEEKNIDVETSSETLKSGGDPIFYQRGLNNTVKVTMEANSNSLGMTLLGALADLIFQKVTSKEYSVTYMHGAITVLNGLLHSFSIAQNSENDLYTISFELTQSSVKTAPTSAVPTVNPLTAAVPL